MPFEDVSIFIVLETKKKPVTLSPYVQPFRLSPFEK